MAARQAARNQGALSSPVKCSLRSPAHPAPPPVPAPRPLQASIPTASPRPPGWRASPACPPRPCPRQRAPSGSCWRATPPPSRPSVCSSCSWSAWAPTSPAPLRCAAPPAPRWGSSLRRCARRSCWAASPLCWPRPRSWRRARRKVGCWATGGCAGGRARVAGPPAEPGAASSSCAADPCVLCQPHPGTMPAWPGDLERASLSHVLPTHHAALTTPTHP